MAGLNLLMRRRALQANPSAGEPELSSYISDSVLLWLDGLTPGDTSIGWQDIVSGYYFNNFGAEHTISGWEFNGASYMDADDRIINYGFAGVNRTLEVVVRFKSKAGSAPVMIGRTSGISFGLSSGTYALGNTSIQVPRVTPTEDLNVAVGFSVSNRSMQIAIENGVTLSLAGSQGAWSAATYLRLGATPSKSIYLEGTIHAIRIHNRLLTQEELLYNQNLDKMRFAL